jgi:hypothetical protein
MKVSVFTNKRTKQISLVVNKKKLDKKLLDKLLRSKKISIKINGG